MKPEELARLSIDQQLKDAGWTVVERNAFNPQDSAVAVCEELLQDNNRADYLLVLYGKAVGVIEAKRKGIDLLSPAVVAQAERYTHMLRPQFPCWELPLPFVFLANGKEFLSKNIHLGADTDFVSVQRFPRPYELRLSMPALNNEAFNEFLLLPPALPLGLRDCQYEAIKSVEASFQAGQKRALLVLATGAGKTRIACTVVHRLVCLSSAVRRVLFLVDRTNLALSALNAFKDYKDGQNRQVFADDLGVSILKKECPLSDYSTVWVATIQLLYSIMGGACDDSVCDNLVDALVDDKSLSTTAPNSSEIAPIKLPDNVLLRPDFFDLIIIDECHRSIYTRWRSVLEFFGGHALMLGLTATPIAETVCFFEHNVVFEYPFERSVVDGINVPPVVYQINTKLTEQGGQICKGETVEVISNLTGSSWVKAAKGTVGFSGDDIRTSIIAPEQIRAVLQEYKEVVFSKLYPERESNFAYLPKTLIFAQSEQHAQCIVQIVKEVFAIPDADQSFVQQITYSFEDSNQRIALFRNKQQCRVAVTVTLVSTGTDIPALEVLLFLTDVRSAVLYQQMKGRGVRSISNDQLHEVTPNAQYKDRFYIVDAVGVTESDKLLPRMSAAEHRVSYRSLEQVLEELSRGVVSDSNMLLCAQKLAAISHRGDPDELLELQQLAPKLNLRGLAQNIFTNISQGLLPPFVSSNAPNFERKAMLAVLLCNMRARNKLIEIAHGYCKVLPQQRDTVIFSGFAGHKQSVIESEQRIRSFESDLQKFAHEEPLMEGIISTDLQVSSCRKLLLHQLYQYWLADHLGFNLNQIWADYVVVSTSDVASNIDHASMSLFAHKREQSQLISIVPLDADSVRGVYTNLLVLFRFALHLCNTLESPASTVRVKRLLERWRSHQSLFPQDEKWGHIYSSIAHVIAINGAILSLSDLYPLDSVLCRKILQLISGDVHKTEELLVSLSKQLLLQD